MTEKLILNLEEQKKSMQSEVDFFTRYGRKTEQSNRKTSR